MKPFTRYTALAAILDRQNVDTDQIVPKQFLKKIERTGFGQHLFHDWRYLDDEETRLNPEFVLNQPRYRGAGILVARDNFGCGSSREHAPWALQEYGFLSIIAPSFADIFFNNCTQNGMVPVVLKSAEVEELFRKIEANEGCKLTVDLPGQKVLTPSSKSYRFDFPAFAKDCLIRGLDQIGWTLQYADKIEEFEKKYYAEHSWLGTG